MLKVKTFESSYGDSLDRSINDFLEFPIIVRSINISSYGYGTSGHQIVTQIVYEEGTTGSKFKPAPSAAFTYTDPDAVDTARQE